jgi:hypothetical protein
MAIVNMAVPIFKFTFLFKMGSNGWSETFYYRQPDQPGITQRDALELAAVRLGLVLKYAATSYVTIKGCRISATDGSGLSFVKADTPFPMVGTTSPNDTAQAVWNSINFTLSNITGEVQRQSQVRGIQNLWTALAPDGTARPNTAGNATLNEFITRYKNQLIFDSTNPNAAGPGEWGMRYKVKASSPSPPVRYQIYNIKINSNNRTLDYYINAPTGWDPGTTVEIHGVRQRCATGLNGVTTVRDWLADPNPPFGQTGNAVIIQTTKVACCNPLPTMLPTSKWKMNSVTYQYVKIGNVQATGASVRKTGRPSGGTRGRRGRACC